MNSNRSAGLLNRLVLLSGLLLLFASCNPYYQVIRTRDAESGAAQVADILNTSYPFSGHKGIHWPDDLAGLDSLLAMDFSSEVYRDIKKLFYRIPDSRLTIKSALDTKLMQQDLSGYLGFDLCRDIDGSCKVIRVDSASQAWEKGLRVGNTILGWNGRSVIRELEEKEIIWGIHPASEAFRLVLTDHFMTRGPAGQSVEVFFENQTKNTRGIRLDFVPAEITLTPAYIGIPKYDQTYPEFRIENNTGILTIPEFSNQFYNRFVADYMPQILESKALIIDLRENQGGLDEVAAGTARWFATQPRLYEESLVWNPADSSWVEMGHLEVEPIAEFQYDKPVLVLVGPKCNGAGEGFGRVISQEQHVNTLGIWNTAGSFSFPGGKIILPRKFTIHYPIGMSLDEDGTILLESPGDYGGGIYPDIRINNDYQTLAAICGGYDLLLESALARLR